MEDRTTRRTSARRRPMIAVAAATALAAVPTASALAAVPDVPDAPPTVAQGWEQPPGPITSASGINDAGLVVGMDNQSRGVVWDAATGTSRLLDPLPGDTTGVPSAINRSGQVAGQSVGRPGFQHAYRWSPDRTTVDLGTIAGDYSYGLDLNDAGHVVGFSSTATVNVYHAFWWAPARGMVDLGRLPGSTRSSAAAVNNADAVVGRADFGTDETDYRYRAFLWTEAGGMVDLGTLGGQLSEATAVNDRGEVTGMATTADGAAHAFLWTAATGMVDLGRLGYGISPVDIDEAGTIVGSWRWTTADGPGDRAFRWTPARGFEDIGLPGGEGSASPTAVNGQGAIVGNLYEFGPGGAYRAFLWRPGPDPRPAPAPRPVPVPIPPRYTG